MIETMLVILTILLMLGRPTPVRFTAYMILKPKTQKTQETQTSSHNSEHTYLDEDSALSDAADF